jgi:hypothetical protein
MAPTQISEAMAMSGLGVFMGFPLRAFAGIKSLHIREVSFTNLANYFKMFYCQARMRPGFLRAALFAPVYLVWGMLRMMSSMVILGRSAETAHSKEA